MSGYRADIGFTALQVLPSTGAAINKDTSRKISPRSAQPNTVAVVVALKGVHSPWRGFRSNACLVPSMPALGYSHSRRRWRH